MTPPLRPRAAAIAYQRSQINSPKPITLNQLALKKRGERCFVDSPKSNSKGEWSEPILLSTSKEQRGNNDSQAAKTKTLSNTLRTSFSCSFVHVNLPPPRCSFLNASLARQSLNRFTRDQSMSLLFLSRAPLMRLNSPPTTMEY